MPRFEMWLVCGCRSAEVGRRLYEPGVCKSRASQAHDSGHDTLPLMMMMETSRRDRIVHGDSLVRQHPQLNEKHRPSINRAKTP